MFLRFVVTSPPAVREGLVSISYISSSTRCDRLFLQCNFSTIARSPFDLSISIIKACCMEVPRYVKDSGDSRKPKLLTKKEKRAVQLQMLEQGGKKGFRRCLQGACESQ